MAELETNEDRKFQSITEPLPEVKSTPPVSHASSVSGLAERPTERPIEKPVEVTVYRNTERRVIRSDEKSIEDAYGENVTFGLVSYVDDKIYDCLILMMDTFDELKVITLEQMMAWLIRDNVRCYAMAICGQVIATATVRNVTGKENMAAKMANFCVSTNYRGVGWGKILLNKIANAEEFIYWTTDREHLPFYVKAGGIPYEEDDKLIWCKMYGEDVKKRLQDLYNKNALESGDKEQEPDKEIKRLSEILGEVGKMEPSNEKDKKLREILEALRDYCSDKDKPRI